MVEAAEPRATPELPPRKTVASDAWQAMVSGAPYHANDPELVAARQRAERRMAVYNVSPAGDDSARNETLAALLGACGPESVVRAPVYVDYGCNIALGRGVFLNFGCVLLDVCAITIGDLTQIGPYVQILTADHPRSADDRASGLEMGQPIHIGRNVWIGGGAILLPGVTIGDDAVIGAGAVVTRDVAPGITVGGNPARPLARGRDRP